MRRGFFARLAAGNIKKNGSTYFPYILTCVVTVMLYYIVKSLSLNPGLEEMAGDQTLISLMEMGTRIIGLFALIFLFYTNSFLLKRRKKEFGVFHILGLGKRHLAKTLAWESLYAFFISMAGGLLFGMALDKLMFLLIAKIVRAEVSLGFFVSAEAIWSTVRLFAVIFLLIFLNAVRQIQVATPVSLLQDSQAGEREPKTKWLSALLGFLCVGTGYYLAITTKNPISSIYIFFIAATLVVVGTYLLFTAGSIAFLKLLRSSKSYYYRTGHFISVSGMIYRMKQNAVGLANICILSTMVLVMISATSSLMIGIDDVVNSRYPYDFVVYSREDTEERSEALYARVRELQQEQGLSVTDEVEYSYLVFSAMQEGNSFRVSRENVLLDADKIVNLYVITLDEYNGAAGANASLSDGEILLYDSQGGYNAPSLKLFDREYQVKAVLDDFPGKGLMAANIASSYFLVVPGQQEMDAIYAKQKEALTNIASEPDSFYAFDTDAAQEEQRAFAAALLDLMQNGELKGSPDSKVDADAIYLKLYGGFFFLGLFLGVLFLMAAVLIIYYKQISEGFEDRERFSIMRKVGLSRREVRAAIRSQVLTVFFLPLLVAGVHVAAAFPLMSRLLALLYLSNTRLYMACTAVSFLVFAAFYVIVYLLTARTYYRIVSR
ncbi:cell division protein FtsX [Lachnoclostridium sp. An131]|uniref:ABC transporter permease n=1 Tax=Lachnoclostridium sp. An131 TaxID=1965555 RepID=UPI000B3ACB09|nr:ABC transporter permease [Lachnoclostridium sp. An131]OUQ24800.1 cell division protein FtsX [Lachnoclostridium sp. An131]